jgi:hypothetical protein
VLIRKICLHSGAVNADNSMSVRTVLATASKSSGPPSVEFTKSTAVDDSYLLGTTNMFDLNTGESFGIVYKRYIFNIHVVFLKFYNDLTLP